MADKKISELTASTTPLSGSEELAVVQSGATKKVSVTNLTAGRAVSASQLDVDNVRTDGNTISITNTDGNLLITPNGNGAVINSKKMMVNGSNSPTYALNVIGSPRLTTIADFSGVGIKSGGYLDNTSKAGFHIEAGHGDNGSNVSWGMYVRRTGSGGGGASALFFSQLATLTGTETQRFELDRDGNFIAKTGNLVIGTAGKGIDFSADGSAAGMTSELLDDYEEGTFTPVFADAASGGNEATVFTALGRYTKVGRLVSYQLALVNIDTTGLTAGNAAVITGFPFTSANISSYSLPVASVGQSSVTTLTGKIWGILTNNSSYLQLIEGRTTGSTGLLVSTLISGSADLFISGQYLTA